MNKINWKDVAARTVKTFIATFIGAFSFADAILLIKDKDEATRYIASSLISAVSAGVTAVWNVLLELFGDRINATVDKVVTWVFDLVRFRRKPAGEGASQIDGAKPVAASDAEDEDEDPQEEENPAELSEVD